MENANPTNTDHPKLQLPDAAPVACESFGKLNLLLEDLDEVPRSRSAEAVCEASENRLMRSRLGVAAGLFAALRAKHRPSAEHCLRVALHCSAWVAQMHAPELHRHAIEVAALLHDVGKIGVPDSLLMKPRALSADEYPVMDEHRRHAMSILGLCCLSDEVLEIVRYASARYDGTKSGFDREGSRIPPGARMLAIVDAFDSMTTDHIYRRAMSRERALAELFENAGSQFDPELVEHFCRLNGDSNVNSDIELAEHWLGQLQSDDADAMWALTEPTSRESMLSPLEGPFHEKLFESMHDGVVFVDTSQRILRWNRGTERMTGIPGAVTDGKLWQPSLIGMCDASGNPIDQADCPVNHAIRSSVQVFRRLQIAGLADKLRTVDVHAVPVLDTEHRVFGAALLLHDASSESQLEQRVSKLYKRSTIDPLTQLANRREFDRVLAETVPAALKRSTPCSLIMCDLDHFKNINDTLGHQVGDGALTHFASILADCGRSGDLVARYGGEEFVVVCPNCTGTAAVEFAERVRRRVEVTTIPALLGHALTVSLGVTELQRGDTAATFLCRADRALIAAKDGGRNRVVQLGAGMEVPSPVCANPAAEPSTWAGRADADWLVKTTVATAVPLNMAVEKLRGFVADHGAEIDEVEGDWVSVTVGTTQVSQTRRRSDRSTPLVVELRFTEDREARSERHESDKGVIRTVVHVVIRPKRVRDRRRRGMRDRAGTLLASLKSYLIAYELSAGRTSDSQGAPKMGFLTRVRRMFKTQTRKPK